MVQRLARPCRPPGPDGGCRTFGAPQIQGGIYGSPRRAPVPPAGVGVANGAGDHGPWPYDHTWRPGVPSPRFSVAVQAAEILICHSAEAAPSLMHRNDRQQCRRHEDCGCHDAWETSSPIAAPSSCGAFRAAEWMSALQSHASRQSNLGRMNWYLAKGVSRT